MSSLAGKYTAEELLSAELSGSKALIESLLFERDNILLVGKEKANKSTLALQICCALTSGQPFLNEYEVIRPIDCVYIQAEGKLTGTKSNLTCMSHAVALDPKKLLFLYYPAIALNTEEGLSQIIRDINSWKRPELIVIDPLYQSMKGSISEQSDSTEMTKNLRRLSEIYQCSQILIHHAHRTRRSESGEILNEGDDSVFGSFVWKAYPDTVLLLERVRGHKDYRRLSCSTQRAGNVVESIDLILMEPDPFYLQIRDGQPIDLKLLEALKAHEGSLTIAQLVERTGKARRHVSDGLQRLVTTRKVSKTMIDLTQAKYSYVY